jgi:predicted Abi (CAAX) family protease
LPEKHLLTFIRMQPQGWRILAFVIALVVLAGVLLFVGSAGSLLSHETVDDNIAGLLSVLVVFLIPLLGGRLLLHELPKLDSIWHSILERPG